MVVSQPSGSVVEIAVLGIIALLVIVFAIIFLVVVLYRKQGSWSCDGEPSSGKCSFTKDAPIKKDSAFATQQECEQSSKCELVQSWFCDAENTGDCTVYNKKGGYDSLDLCQQSSKCKVKQSWFCTGENTGSCVLKDAKGGYDTQQKCESSRGCKQSGTWLCSGIGTEQCNYSPTSKNGFVTEQDCTNSTLCSAQGKMWACNGAGTCTAYPASSNDPSNDPPNGYPTKAACQKTCA